jgi:hypothetical protein
VGRAVTDAQRCRSNGWTVGTYLVGDEGYGPTIIKITAIGERRVLARMVSHNGKAGPRDGETTWMLRLRDWQVKRAADRIDRDA